jgi:hypothetical protein
MSHVPSVESELLCGSTGPASFNGASLAVGARPHSAVSQIARPRLAAWEMRERSQRRRAAAPSHPFSSHRTSRSRSPPPPTDGGRDPFGLKRSAKHLSSELGPLPVFGRGSKAVTIHKVGPRFQNMEVRYITKAQVRQAAYGTHSPGPVYSSPSDFGAVPPLPGSHFLMRTSPLLKLGIGSAAELRIQEQRNSE